MNDSKRGARYILAPMAGRPCGAASDSRPVAPQIVGIEEFHRRLAPERVVLDDDVRAIARGASHRRRPTASMATGSSRPNA